MNNTSIYFYEKDIEGLDMEPYKTFFVPFDSTKLNLNNINDPVKNRASSRDKGEKPKDKVVAPIYDEITLSKESIRTQKATDGPNLKTKSEAPEPEVTVVDKLRSGLSVDSGLTGETRSIVTPEKRIPGKDIKYKITKYVSTKKGYNSKSG